MATDGGGPLRHKTQLSRCLCERHRDMVVDAREWEPFKARPGEAARCCVCDGVVLENPPPPTIDQILRKTDECEWILHCPIGFQRPDTEAHQAVDARGSALRSGETVVAVPKEWKSRAEAAEQRVGELDELLRERHKAWLRVNEKLVAAEAQLATAVGALEEITTIRNTQSGDSRDRVTNLDAAKKMREAARQALSEIEEKE